MDVHAALQKLLQFVLGSKNRHHINWHDYLPYKFHVVEIGLANWRIIEQQPDTDYAEFCQELVDAVAMLLQCLCG